MSQSIPSDIIERKKQLRKQHIEFAVKPGAFGFENVSKVKIGIPFENFGMTDENVPIEVTFLNGTEKLVSCKLFPNGNRHLHFYKDGGAIEDKSMISDGKCFKWENNGQLIDLEDTAPLAVKSANVIEQSTKVWHNYIKGAYDRQPSVTKQNTK